MNESPPVRGISEPERSEKPGIRCPRCGSRHLAVTHTRYQDSRVRRYRKCKECKRRLVTSEQVDFFQR